MDWFRAVVHPRVGHGKITASMCPPSRTRHSAWQIRAALAGRRKVRLYRKPLDQAAVPNRKSTSKVARALIEAAAATGVAASPTNVRQRKMITNSLAHARSTL